jgi:Raf kinase inhibitor-like YbhB/YbcL family protein
MRLIIISAFNAIKERRNEMQKIILISVVLALFVAGNVGAQEFTLRSNDMEGQLTQSQVFSGFGCSGKNISPSLKWINAPSNTKSFAVTVYDPDAPTGSGWWHWVIFNIPAGVNELKADAGRIEKNLAPAGSIQSVTDFGKPGFGGACPPQGDKSHRYIFTVYALSITKLDLDEKTPPAMVGFFLNSNTIAKASLIAYYQR